MNIPRDKQAEIRQKVVTSRELCSRSGFDTGQG